MSMLGSIGGLSVRGMGLFGQKASAPITVTTLGTHSDNTGTIASTSINIGVGGVPAGSLIVLIAGEGGQVSAVPYTGASVTDSAGNTYYLATGAQLNGSAYYAGTVWYAYNSTALVNGNVITYHLADPSDGQVSLSAMYASGVLTGSSPLDGAVTAFLSTAASPTVTVTSGTPSQAGELFIGATITVNPLSFVEDAADGWAVPPTAISTVMSIGGGSQVNSGSGTKTFVFTSASNFSYSAIVGFKHQ